jgi:hypothetical protein
MPRLSIDISAQDHQQLKAIAALKGQSIKDYVLSRTLGNLPDEYGASGGDALAELRRLLAPRVEEAVAGHLSPLNIDGVIAAAKSRKSGR